MERALRELVRERAESCCEYCGLHQDHDRYYAFHLEHIVARQHGGSTHPANLFHPRRDRWERHFRWKGPILTGRTAVGRATVAVLQINSRDRVELRKLLLDQGLFPPSGARLQPKRKRRPQ